MFKVKVTGPRKIDLGVPIACPECKRTIKVKARTCVPDTTITCTCGAKIRLEGDDLRKLQKAMDGLLDTMHGIGKGRR